MLELIKFLELPQLLFQTPLTVISNAFNGYLKLPQLSPQTPPTVISNSPNCHLERM